MIPPKDKDGNGGGPPVPSVTTVIAPAAFVGKLKLENEMFRGAMQQVSLFARSERRKEAREADLELVCFAFERQDAHEFLNYLLNKIGEDLESDEKERKTASRENLKKRLEMNGNGHHDGGVDERECLLQFLREPLSAPVSLASSELKQETDPIFLRVFVLPVSDSLASLSTAQTPGGSSSSRQQHKGPEQTFVQKLFEGKLTNETRCLTCETVSTDSTLIEPSKRKTFVAHL